MTIVQSVTSKSKSSQPADGQSFLAIEPIDTLGVDGMAFPAEQDHQAAVAEPAALFTQGAQTIPQNKQVADYLIIAS